MTAAAHVLAPALAKEVRALLPTYGAALIAVVVGSFGNGYILVASGLLGFAFGSVALGAQSFGHEYSNRTLGLLLSQPLDRRRLFAYKLAVLSVMLITLTGTTLVMYQELLRRAASPHTEPRMLVLAAACGLFVAPCLTMLCRSTLAGAVFTIAIPGLLSTGADVAGSIIYGLHSAAAIDRFRLVVFWPGMFVICALSAIAGWRIFQRLEVIEGHGEHVQFPDSLRVGSTTLPASRRRHPVWMLVWKELRLQQITFVVAGLFALAWLGLAGLERVQSDSPRLPMISITILSACVLAMLAGALASAEERHLGTAQWQILLPMAAWRQWTVKVGVVYGIVLVLGGGVPAVLGFLIPVREWFTPTMVRQVGAIALLLATGTLYVSSLCRSGIAALSMSFPIVVATAVAVRVVAEFLFGLVSARLPPETRQWLRADVLGILFFAAAGGLIALVLWLAFLNHRTADRGAARTSTQVLGIAGYVAVGLTVLIALGLR